MSDLPPINQKYGVDTTDFKAGLAAMAREIRVLDSAFKASAAELGDWSNTASGLEGRMETLTKLIDIQRDRVAATRAEYERLVREKGESSKAAKDMEIRLNRETEQLNKYERELSDSKGKLGELERATDQAADELNHMERETGGASKSLEHLKGIMGGLGSALKIGIAGMLGLVGAAAAVGAGIGKLVQSSTEAAGQLVDLSEKTGITVERLQELAYVGDQVGVGSDTMVSAMEKLVRSMDTARDQTIDFQEKSGIAAQKAAQQAAEIEDDYAKSSGKVQAKLVQAEKDANSEREKLRKDLRESLSKIAGDTLKDLEKLEEQHLSKMADLKSSIGKVEADFEHDSTERKEDLTRELTRMEKDYNHDREKLLAELGEAETDEEKRRVQAKIDELDYEYNTRKTRREEDAEEAESDAEYAKNERIKALQEQLKAETAEYDKQSKAIQAQQLEQEQATQARYQKEIKAAQERYDAEVVAAGQAMDEIAAKRTEALAGNKVEAELGDQAKAYQELGVSVTDANGNLRDMQTVFDEALAALGKVENATERDALAMAIFGKSAMDLNPLIKAGRDEISRLAEEAHEVGAVMSEDTVRDLEGFGDSVASLIAGLKGTGGELANAFLPGLTGLVDQARVYIGEFGQIVRSADGDLVQMANGIGGLLGRILTDFAKQGPEMLQAGLLIIQGILDAIVKNLPMLLDGAVQIINMLIKFIVDNLPTLTKTGVEILLTLIKAILDNLPMIVEAGIEALLALIEGLTEAMPELIPAIVEAITLIDQVIIEHLPEIIGAGGKLLLAIVKGLAEALPVLIDKTPELIQALVDAFVELMPIVAKIGWEIIKAIAGMLVENLPELGKAILGLPGVLNEAMGKIWQEIWQIGSDIIAGVWQGMQDRRDQFFTDVWGFFSGLAGAAKDALGMHSPSKVFAAIGENAAGSYVDSLGAALQSGTRQLQQAFGETALTLQAQTPALATAAAAAGDTVYSGDTYNVTFVNSTQSQASAERDIRKLNMLYGKRS